MSLTERQEEILFAIIEEYAEMAAPVGSVTLAKLFDVSSATIRAEMAKLEAAGLIAQPHTSAGRIPTDAGYRLYVNSLTEEIDEEVERGAEEERGGAKSVEKWAKETERSARGVEKWAKASDRGAHALEIRIMSQTRADYAIRGAVDSLVELTGNLGLATIGDQLYLSGISRLFMQPEFVDNQRIVAVAKLLDNLEPWLREARPGEPLNIFIGNENPIGKSAQVSLIISKFRSPFSDNSYIGVLGPTRQDYPHIMNLVRKAGNILEESL